LKKRFSLTNDPILVDIEEAIKYCRLLLDSIPPGGSFSSNVAISLAELLKLAFDRTQNIEQLDESIGLLADILEVLAGQALFNYIVGTLTSSLFERRKVLIVTLVTAAMEVTRQTIETALEVLSLAADNKFISLPSRLGCSFTLVELLQYIRGIGSGSVTSISTAFERAMSLMQDSVIIAPNLHLQHSQLVAMIQVIERLPLDYASHLIDIHQYERAIETLERGRALLWSESRGLRTSIQHIAGVDPLLAENSRQ
jgi:hypothetical protein